MASSIPPPPIVEVSIDQPSEELTMSWRIWSFRRLYATAAAKSKSGTGNEQLYSHSGQIIASKKFESIESNGDLPSSSKYSNRSQWEFRMEQRDEEGIDLSLRCLESQNNQPFAARFEAYLQQKGTADGRPGPGEFLFVGGISIESFLPLRIFNENGVLVERSGAGGRGEIPERGKVAGFATISDLIQRGFLREEVEVLDPLDFKAKLTIYKEREEAKAHPVKAEVEIMTSTSESGSRLQNSAAGTGSDSNFIPFPSNPAERKPFRCQLCGRYYYTKGPRDLHELKCDKTSKRGRNC